MQKIEEILIDNRFRAQAKNVVHFLALDLRIHLDISIKRNISGTSSKVC